MTSTSRDNSGHSDLRGRWEAWARRQFGDNETRVQAATDAAMRASLHGASSQEAAAAAKAAASMAARPGDDAVGAGPDEPQIGRPDAERHTPAQVTRTPGMIVGQAQRVQKQQQLVRGGSIQTVEFRLEPQDSPPVVVQMRGFLLEGVVADGDVVEVPSVGMRGGFIQTDHLYNRTTDSVVRMRKGVSGSIAVAETLYGRRFTRTVYVLFFTIFFLIAAVIIGVILFSTVLASKTQPSSPSPPAWYCESARKAGMQVPGC